MNPIQIKLRSTNNGFSATSNYTLIKVNDKNITLSESNNVYVSTPTNVPSIKIQPNFIKPTNIKVTL
jgi:hypothetical protein